MGMLFQFGALFADMDVMENVAFPLREHTDLPPDLVRDVVLMKLNAVGLRGARGLMPSGLSGGMARRVALARAIALGTAARLIRELNDAMGLTSLFVSHDIEQTFAIADRVIILANGRIAVQGTPQEVRASTDPLVHQYVNALPDGPVHFHYPGVSVAEDLGLGAVV